jgi:tRNA U55 pseudouridine synthase TruB
MTTRIDTNQTWDAQGRLVSEQQVEVTEEPVDATMAAFVATLSTEQQAALQLALGL